MQNFLQNNQRDARLLNIELLILRENLQIHLFLNSNVRNFEKQCCQWCGVKRIKSCFRE